MAKDKNKDVIIATPEEVVNALPAVTSKASINKLNKLHDMLANYFLDVLETGEDTISSGTITAMNTFLKNNNVGLDIIPQDPSSKQESITYRIDNILRQEIEYKK